MTTLAPATNFEDNFPTIVSGDGKRGTLRKDEPAPEGWGGIRFRNRRFVIPLRLLTAKEDGSYSLSFYVPDLPITASKKLTDGPPLINTPKTKKSVFVKTDSERLATVLESSFYQTALNALPDPVMIVAPRGEVVACNRAWRHLVGQRDAAARYLGLSYDQAHHMLCAQAASATFSKRVRAVLDGTLPDYGGLCNYVLHERVHGFRVSVTPLDGHQGCSVGYRDITEQP